MLISLDGQGPLYQRVYRGLRDLILEGQVTAGARLPATRDFAVELGVSRNVVLLAYEELIAEGYAVGRVGAGTYVSTDIPVLQRPASALTAVPAPPLLNVSTYSRRLADRAFNATPRAARLPYDFDHGLATAPADFPSAIWKKLTVRRLRAPALEYMHPSGCPELRAALAIHLKRSRGVDCDPSQVLIVNGSLQALDLTARVLLDPGDSVVVEDPHYPGAREVFLAAGAQLKTARVDDSGIVTDDLPLSAARLKFAYVTPSHQYPSGSILSVERRMQLLAWAERTGAYIVEDDYDSEYCYGAAPIEAMQGIDGGQRVIYMGTFSRILFPALRLGYMVLPKALAPLFTQTKQLADRHSPPLAQQVLADFIRDGHLERHIRKCRVRKAALRAAFLHSVARHLGSSAEVRGTDSGTHAMVTLGGFPVSRVEELRRAAAHQGVGVYPARKYYLDPPARTELLMGYGALTPEQVRAGVKILAGVLDFQHKRAQDPK